jgi:hypothetical protein
MKAMTMNARILFLFLTTASAAMAADFTTLSYPVSVNVDQAYVRSSMYLKFDAKTYNLPIDRFAERQLDAREAMFLSFMNAMRARDVERVEALVDNSAVTFKQEGPVQISAEPLSPKKIVELYHANTGGFQKLEVIAQVMHGPHSLFVWQSNSAPKPVRWAFRVSPIGEKLVVSEVTAGASVDLLLIENVMKNSLRDPRTPAPVANLKKRFEFNLGDSKVHPVVLQFDGVATDIDIFEGPSTPSEIVSLYRSAFGALRLQAKEQYLTYFTPPSRKRMEQNFKLMPAEALEQYLEQTVSGGRVRFILSADPVFIVFRTPMNDFEAVDGALTYDTLVRDGASSKLRFANVSNLTFLDGVLRNPAVFDAGALIGTPRQQAEVTQ